MIMEIQKIKDYIDARLQELGNNTLEEKRNDELKRLEQFIMSEENQEKSQEEEPQPEEKKKEEKEEEKEKEM